MCSYPGAWWSSLPLSCLYTSPISRLFITTPLPFTKIIQVRVNIMLISAASRTAHLLSNEYSPSYFPVILSYLPYVSHTLFYYQVCSLYLTLPLLPNPIFFLVYHSINEWEKPDTHNLSKPGPTFSAYRIWSQVMLHTVFGYIPDRRYFTQIVV